MKNAILYARQSVKKPAEDISFLIEGQLDAMREFAASKGLNVVQEYRENQSGSTLNRPILTQVRIAVKNPDVDYLIVDRLDRLTRGGNSDLAILLKELELASVTLLTVRMDFDSSTAEGRFNILTMATLSNYQIGLIAENQASVRLSQLRQHKAISPSAPFGYYYDSDTGHYLIEVEEAKVVRLIFKLHTENDHGSHQIRELVNATLGTEYPVHLVSGVLMKASKYAEHYHHEKYGDFEHIYPAIISDEIAEQSTKIRLESTFNRTNKFWLLRRKILCPYCERKLATHKVGQHRYYYCLRNGQHKDLGTINVNADVIEALVLSTVRYLLNGPKVQSGIQEKVAMVSGTRKQKLQRQQQALTQKTNRLVKKFGDGLIDEVEFKAQLRNLKAVPKIVNDDLTTLLQRFTDDQTYQLNVINKLIDYITVDNIAGEKSLTGIFINGVSTNQLRQAIKI